MYINNNSFNRLLNKNIENMSQLTHKLSTGNRINKASDDASGLQVSTRLTSQIRGTSQAIRNIQDGISFLNTIDGGLESAQNILQRLRELAVQGKNGTYSVEQRKAIESEMTEILDTLAQTNKSNNLAQGIEPGSAAFVSGNSAADQRITINNIPVNTTPGAKTTVEFWMNWNGNNSVIPFGWNRAYDLYMNGGKIGINTGVGNELTTSSTGMANKWTHVAAVFVNGSPDTNNVELYLDGEKQTLTRQLGSVNQVVTPTIKLGGWGANSGFDFGGLIDELKIWDGTRTGEQIKSDMSTTNSGNEAGLLGYWKFDSTELKDETANGNNGQFSNGATLGEGVSVAGGGLSIHTGSTPDSKDTINFSPITEQISDLKNISISDPDILDKIDKAIDAVSAQRGEIGAKINHYEYKISNQQNLVINTEAARMRVRDIDMASSMAEMTKEDIKMNSVQRMISVSNSNFEQQMKVLVG